MAVREVGPARRGRGGAGHGCHGIAEGSRRGHGRREVVVLRGRVLDGLTCSIIFLNYHSEGLS